MQLIKTYRQIARREMLDCRIKSLQEWVRHYGLNLHSYEIMLLSESYTFMYDRIQIPGVAIEALPYAVASQNQVEIRFFRNLNIQYHQEHISGDLPGWEQLKSLIDQDIPVLFKIDSRFLRGAEDASPRALKLNLYYLSTLLLVGYDEEQDQALVVLTNDDERENVNEISIREFQTYRHSSCVPFSPEGLCYYLKPDDGDAGIRSPDIRQAILNSIIATTNIMLNEGEPLQSDLGVFIGEAGCWGIQGMKRLQVDLQGLLLQCKTEGSSAIIRLKIVFLRNNLLFGSYSSFREEFGQCIKYCALKYNVPYLYDAGSEFAQITSLWKELFTLFSRIAHNKGELAGNLLQAVQVWEKIIVSEQQQFTAIKTIFSTASM